jgi:hypothetical protein
MDKQNLENDANKVMPMVIGFLLIMIISCSGQTVVKRDNSSQQKQKILHLT